MNACVFALLPLWIVSIQGPGLAENGTPAKTNGAPASADVTREVDQTQSLNASAPDARIRELAQRIQAATTNQSPAVVAIAGMAEAGVEASVIEAYVQTVNVSALRSDEILYLHTHGVSPQVITALIKRSAEIKGQQAQVYQQAQERLAQQLAAQTASESAYANASPPVQPAPVYNYYVTSPPAYNYGYPSYAYAYAAYPTFGYSYVRPFSSFYSSPFWGFNPAFGARGYCPPLVSRHGFNVGMGAPRSTPFYTSRWTWIGSTGKPVDRTR